MNSNCTTSILRAADLCIKVVLRREDSVVKEQLQSFLYVVVTEILKRRSRRSAAVRWIAEAGSINDHDGRHYTVVGQQRAVKHQLTAT